MPGEPSHMNYHFLYKVTKKKSLLLPKKVIINLKFTDHFNVEVHKEELSRF